MQCTCLPKMIAASLARSWDSSIFFSNYSDRVPKRQKKRRDWSLHFILSSWDSVFSLLGYYLAHPNGQGMRNWISKNISKFYNNPTFNLMKQILLLLENLILRRTFHIGPSKSMWNNMRWQICNYVLRKQRWWKVACLRMLVTTTGLVMTIVERRNPQHFKIAVVCEVD